jgi:hypothetical protein
MSAPSNAASRWRRRLIVCVSVIVIVTAAVLAGGFGWSGLRGYVWISVHDVAAEPGTEDRFAIEIVFRAADGQRLASARRDSRYGSIRVKHPTLGFCEPTMGRESWYRCNATVASWVMQWVKRAVAVDLRLDNCQIENAPIGLHRQRHGVYSWWVPLPHVGGAPYTQYSLYLRIDSTQCIMTA